MAEPTSTISQDDEQWADVPDFSGVYGVSSFGRFRRQMDDPRHAVQNRAGSFLSPRADRKGYFRVRLTPPGGKVRSYSVHRLVAAAFLGPCPAGHQVNHKDANKANNRSDNLEYVTDSENMRHAARAGRLGQAKLSPDDVREIRRLLAVGERGKTIAARFKVSAPTIYLIKTGRAWGHLDGFAAQPVAAPRPRSTWRN